MTGFDPPPPFPLLATSDKHEDKPYGRKLHRRAFMGICLLLSLSSVFVTAGLYPWPLRPFGMRNLGSEISTKQLEVVDSMGSVESAMTSLTASVSDQVRFDNYSLILKGQRIFL